MKNKRFLYSISCTAAAVLLAAAMFAEVFGATVMKTTQWPFLFWDGGIITDEMTESDLTVIGRDNGVTRIDEDEAVLILSGNGSTNKSCIKVRVKGSCRLRLRLCSTTFSSTLAVSDGSRLLGEIDVPGKSNTGNREFDYIGPESDLYVYSENRGVHVYIFAVDYERVVVGDVTGDGLVKEDDAAAVLKHISGSKILTDRLKYADYNIDGSIDANDAAAILGCVIDNKYSPEFSEADTSDGVTASTHGELYNALRKDGAKVYVTEDIEMFDRLYLTKGGQTIIGVPKADGSLPVLNFADMEGDKDIINESSGDGDVGIKIKSANNVIENLIVENAHDNGIQLKGEEVTGNTIRNCIIRYNNDSGLQITGGAYNNTVENVLSYRNCDVYTRGSNADGFAVKLGAGIANTTNPTDISKYKNTFINCYAWDNGDDAWDSYDKPVQDTQTYNVVYENCMCWNNGSPALHMGYNDYINGSKLDEDLPFIRRIAVTNPTGYTRFKNAYNNRTLCSAAASKEEYGAAVDALLNKKINTDNGELTVSELINDYNWSGNPNGFKLGSAYTESVCVRSLKNCIAFDHGKKGFDRNNAACKVSLENCFSFGNTRNYKLDEMNITGFKNVFGRGGKDSDNMPDGYEITIPVNAESMEVKARNAAHVIIRYAANNKIVDTGIFAELF